MGTTQSSSSPRSGGKNARRNWRNLSPDDVSRILSSGIETHNFALARALRSKSNSPDKLLEICDRLASTSIDDRSQALAEIYGSDQTNAVRSIASDFCTLIGDAKNADRFLDHILDLWRNKSNLDAIFHDSQTFERAVEEVVAQILARPVEGPRALPELSLKSELLSPSTIAALNAWLPSERRAQWTRLFSNTSDGNSFVSLCSAIASAGPVLVVISARNSGAILGGFASLGLERGPKPVGDDRSFVFSAHPQLRVFSATGYASNYAYLNQSLQTLPKGIGFGGNPESMAWAFFVDDSMRRGKASRNVATFEKCHLAGENDFEVEKIEVWRVGDPPKVYHGDDWDGDEEDCVEPKHHRSILQKDAAAKAILEMAGRKMHADGFKEVERPASED